MHLYSKDFNIILIGLFVAIGEEWLFRGLIQSLISKYSNEFVGILISAMIFAVVLHINYPLLLNLLVRFPLGILFSLIKKYVGLPEAMMSHWIYNFVLVFCF